AEETRRFAAAPDRKAAAAGIRFQQGRTGEEAERELSRVFASKHSKPPDLQIGLPQRQRARDNDRMHSTPQSLLFRLCAPVARVGTSIDQRAWERFVDLYSPLLYFWARRLEQQETDALDLVQEVFLQLHQKLPEFRYDRRQSFRSWLR